MSIRGSRIRLAIACGVLLAAMLLRTQFELALTLGNSMSPSLHNGDLLIVQKSAYRTADPQRGDIVVARCEGDLIVKRVVGLPREIVELKQGALYINGVPMPEHHLVQPGALHIAKGMLCEGRFALLGDNRALPIEVLVHGVVGKEDIVGKVIFDLESLLRYSKSAAD